MIDHIENSLYAIYCQSILLSTHLLQSENLQTLDQLSKDLGKHENIFKSIFYKELINVKKHIMHRNKWYYWILDLDRNDIPILMSIASVHTPELTERYKLSFSF